MISYCCGELTLAVLVAAQHAVTIGRPVAFRLRGPMLEMSEWRGRAPEEWRP